MDFISFLQLYSSISYFIMFLVAFLEVLVIFGNFFPGQNLIIISGVLVQRGGFDLIPLNIIVFLGTILGNTLGYYIGKTYGETFLLKFGKLFYLEEKHLKITKKYMDHHAGKTMIIGRFNYMIRSFIPFIAGTTNVNFNKFMFYNILGSALWTTVFISTGYLIGEAFDFATGYVTLSSTIATIITTIIFYILYRKIREDTM